MSRGATVYMHRFTFHLLSLSHTHTFTHSHTHTHTHSLLWTEGGAQSSVEQALGLTAGYPAVAALSKDKGVFATMRGSFNTASIGSFITGLTTGKEVTAPLAGM
jgi:hypothetical protein